MMKLSKCTIDPEFLSFNNLYRKSERNADKNKQGFFEDAGRVRCIKLRGIGSEGFIMPINTLESFVGDIEDWESLVGTEFDSINNKKFVWKYILKPNGNNSSNGKQPPAKEVLNIVNNQYRQHVDTVQLQKAMYDAKLFNIIVYRITSTDIQGRVHEWSVRQMIDYCDKYGINHIKELYYGKAKDLFDLSTEQHWHENFIESLRETYLERDSILCNNKVPEEGIVLRREVSDISVYKLKSVNFLERESKALDKGTIDIESTQE